MQLVFWSGVLHTWAHFGFFLLLGTPGKSIGSYTIDAQTQ